MGKPGCLMRKPPSLNHTSSADAVENLELLQGLTSKTAPPAASKCGLQLVERPTGAHRPWDKRDARAATSAQGIAFLEHTEQGTSTCLGYSGVRNVTLLERLLLLFARPLKSGTAIMQVCSSQEMACRPLWYMHACICHALHVNKLLSPDNCRHHAHVMHARDTACSSCDRLSSSGACGLGSQGCAHSDLAGQA